MNRKKKVWLYLYWRGNDGEPDIGYGIEKRGLWYIGASIIICPLLLACVLLSYLSALIGTLAIIGIGVFQYYQSFRHYGYYEVDRDGMPIHQISSGPNIPAIIKGRKTLSKSRYLRNQN